MASGQSPFVGLENQYNTGVRVGLDEFAARPTSAGEGVESWNGS